MPVQHGLPSFYSNNVFYEAVDVLRFWGSGIVPSEKRGGGWWGVGGVSLQRPTMLAYVRGGFYGQSSV